MLPEQVDRLRARHCRALSRLLQWPDQRRETGDIGEVINDETMIDAVRRDYLIAKALAYCVAAMERLPFYQRELSDQKDMQTLFDTILIPEADREQLRREARERFPRDD